MRTLLPAAVMAAVLLALVATTAMAQTTCPAMGSCVTPEAITATTANWMPEPRALATTLMAKYGPPQELTLTSMTWYGNGPWKRTVLRNELVRNNFPTPHNDMLYQTINYRVPVDRMDDLAALTGSLVVDRTRGELTSGADTEAHNILAINLANEVATGKLSAEEARRFYARAPQDHPDYLRAFVFTLPQGNTADAGKEAIPAQVGYLF